MTIRFPGQASDLEYSIGGRTLRLRRSQSVSDTVILRFTMDDSSMQLYIPVKPGTRIPEHSDRILKKSRSSKKKIKDLDKKKLEIMKIIDSEGSSATKAEDIIKLFT